MTAIQALADEHRANRGFEFSQYCRLLMLAKGHALDAVSLAETHRAAPRVLEALRQRAVVGAIGSGVNGPGAELQSVCLLANAFQDGLANSSAYFQMAIVKVPLNVVTGSVLSVMSAATLDAAEAAPLMRLDIGQVTVALRKAGVVVLTNELMREAPNIAEALITRYLTARTAEAVDDDALGTLLLAAPSFTGTASLLNDVATLLRAVNLTTASRPYFIASPTVAVNLATTHTSGTRHFPNASPLGGSIYEIPMLVSSGVPLQSLMLVDAARVVGNYELPTVDISKHASLQMDSAPTMSGGVGSPNENVATAVTNLWQVNATGLKATAFYGVAKLTADTCAVVSYAGSP